MEDKESDLCEAFMTQARSMGWTCYPEVSGWDILLQQEDVQIGVQAKLHLNTCVVEQAVEIGYPTYRNGPGYRAVLTPKSTGKIRFLRMLKLLHFCPQERYMKAGLDIAWLRRQNDMYWRPLNPAWIPDVVPEGLAGAPSPIRLTKWKQQALRLFAKAKVQGYVTSADIKALGISPTVFQRTGWLIPDGKVGRMQRLILAEVPGRVRPDQQHPDVFETFCAELNVSGPPELTMD